MGKSIRNDKFCQLRDEFPVFTYRNYSYELDVSGLRCSFRFETGPDHVFCPSFFIPRKDFFLPDEVIAPGLPSLVFHIGLIELISYWKAACPPVVEIIPHGLTGDQQEWWKRVYFHGLGEFFYLNGIDTGIDRFMEIRTANESVPLRPVRPVNEGVIIPVGGGKDSVVTLEVLGKQTDSLPLVMNPVKASLDCIRRSGCSEGGYLEIRRTLDPHLLELNSLGFLNGHTPFSALLAFYTILAAHITGRRYIALSNESSANEPTIPGTMINHQFSKSFAFETDFRDYVKKYLSSDTEYFSFLRPLHEIQIARLFAGYPQYHDIFRSCNAGNKTNSWCGKCSKCLFAWIILSPFISEEKMNMIFGKDLYNDPDLTLYFDQLTGLAAEKPFDCVGTVDEVNAAVREVIRQRAGRPLPLLLQRYLQHSTVEPPAGEPALMQHSFDPHHRVPAPFLKLLKNALYA